MSLSVCLRDSALRPYTFGTHRNEIFQSVLDLQSSVRIQETSTDEIYTSI